MPSHAAIGIDNDFSARQPGISMRSADYEPAGGIDVELRGGVHQVGGDHGVDDVLLYLGAKLLSRNLVIMLGGDHHGLNALGLVTRVFHANLALSIGPQEIELAVTPHFAQLANQFVGHHDRQRHQLRGFITSETEHQALVAGASSVHAHGDVGRLALNRINDAAGFAVEAEVRVGIPDVLNDAPHQAGHVDIGSGGDFTRNHADSGGDQNLAGDPTLGVV